MKVLLVGAGAVGQAYGRHFQKAGAEVAFLVKPKYLEQTRAGFTLYAANRWWWRRWEPQRFEPDRVLTEAAEAGEHDWDAVVLCVSSTALRGPWLEELIGAVGEAPLVTLQPGMEDREYILRFMPESRLVSGLITLVAWYAPLAGEQRYVPRPGVAVWFPPLSPSPMSGPEQHVGPIVEALRKGGFPAKAKKQDPSAARVGPALLTPIMAALEFCGWSFRSLRRWRNLRLAQRGAGEALAVASRKHGESVPLLPRLAVWPGLLWWATRLSPLMLPFDPEVYFEDHFTKVGDQTRFALETYIERAGEYGLPAEHLSELLEGIGVREGE